MRYDPREYLKPTIADSRLRTQVGFGGSIIPRVDVGHAGLTLVFCSNCGNRAGAVRFDEAAKTLAEVICDNCVKKFGKPPGAQYRPNSPI